MLYKVIAVGKSVPEWAMGLVADEIFAPNLTAVHRSWRWCVARFRDSKWDLNMAPVVTWIRNVDA